MEIKLSRDEAEYELRKYYHNTFEIAAKVNITAETSQAELCIAEREIHGIAFLARMPTHKIAAIKLLRTCAARNNLRIGLQTAKWIVEMMAGNEAPHTLESAEAVYKEISGCNLS